MRNLHALVLACLAPCLALSALADAPSPLSPISREGTKSWKDRYDQQVEQLRNNPCGVLFLGDSITDYWDRDGKQAWDKMFKPYHPCNFGISGDQTTNLIYRITHSGMPAQTDPKLCIVMIGTNNTGHFKGGEDPEKTAIGILGAAQHLLVRFPDTHVLLLGIFPRGSGPQDKLRQHNDKINAIVAQCKLPRTTYVNINKRFLDSSGRLLPGISRDNLHFTEKATPSGQTPYSPTSRNTAGRKGSFQGSAACCCQRGLASFLFPSCLKHQRQMESPLLRMTGKP